LSKLGSLNRKKWMRFAMQRTLLNPSATQFKPSKGFSVITREDYKTLSG